MDKKRARGMGSKGEKMLGSHLAPPIQISNNVGVKIFSGIKFTILTVLSSDICILVINLPLT